MNPEPVVRIAADADIAAIAQLLADDPLGRLRERDDHDLYAAAFREIERDPNNAIYVVERGGEVGGCAQLTIIPGLGRGAMRRAQIESVRIASHLRGAGLGLWFMGELIRTARARGCGLVQLTTDKSRVDAHRFYERLGFEASHVGYKLRIA